MKYAVVIDAGSSGSRAHIYSWPDPKSYVEGLAADSPMRSALLPIETQPDWVSKIRPGISSYAGSSQQDICKNHIDPLLAKAYEVVPRESRSETPLYFLATAGLRLLPDQDQQDILTAVCMCLQGSQFYVPECATHATVIDGKAEGMYGWLGLNYLVHWSLTQMWDDFDTTYGFLDMGGASAQIAFVPEEASAEKHADDLYEIHVRTVGGTPINWKLFVTTWLGFGANESQQRLRAQLISELTPEQRDPYQHGAPIPVVDPCLPRNTRDLRVKNDTEFLFVGSGDFSQCSSRALDLLNKNVECLDEPCLFDGKHVPGFGDFSTAKYVGVSEYWYTLQDIIGNNGTYDYAKLEDEVRNLCSSDWSDVRDKYKDMDAEFLQNACFKSAWVLTVLDKGFNFPLEADGEHNFQHTFQSAIYIQGAEISWTLGRALLYASSQIPAASDANPVGYSSFGEALIPGGEIVETTVRSHHHFNSDSDEYIWGIVLLLGVLVGLFYVGRRFATLGSRLRKLAPTWLADSTSELPFIERDPMVIPLEELRGGVSTSLTSPSNVPSRVSSRMNLRSEWD